MTHIARERPCPSGRLDPAGWTVASRSGTAVMACLRGALSTIITSGGGSPRAEPPQDGARPADPADQAVLHLIPVGLERRVSTVAALGEILLRSHDGSAPHAAAAIDWLLGILALRIAGRRLESVFALRCRLDGRETLEAGTHLDRLATVIGDAGWSVAPPLSPDILPAPGPQTQRLPPPPAG